MKPDKLLVCAHPDDETLFFGGLLLQHPGEFKLICVTDANADGRGDERMEEFKRAAKKLGVKHISMLDFPDIYEKRLNIEKLMTFLQKEKNENYHFVYTHNIIGEYGHPHHQDVCFAVHNTFDCPVLSTAYNVFPAKIINLTQEQFEIKSEILTEIYGEETRRFLNLLPITATEGYQQTSFIEVNAIYDFLANEKDLSDLDKFDHLRSYITSLKNLKRIF